jgi:hypothetical protein
MKRRIPTLAGLCAVLAWLSLAPAPSSGAKPAAPQDVSNSYGRNLPGPTGPGFLPDSFVIARVSDRVVRCGEFVDAYFNSYAEFRPNGDSLGRVEFLKSNINKQIMALTARSANRPFTFEDRHALREHSNRVYSNVLYQRVVMDSVQVTDESVREAYEYFKYQTRLRHVMFAQRAVGERVRGELIAGRISWPEAIRRYSIADDRDQGGDLGWQSAGQLGLELAGFVHKLKPGESTSLIQTRDGWNVFQCMDRRPVDPPAFDGIASLIRSQLAGIQSNNRADELQDRLVEEIGLVIDTTNVKWASSLFGAATHIEQQEGAPTLSFDVAVPEFAPADTSRILARWRDGQLSLGQFMSSYMQHNPLMRPNVNDFWLMRNQVIAVSLDPYMVELALKRGIDKDPIAVKMVEQRREEIMVDHLFADSVESKIWIRPEDRRKYYEAHKHEYVTFVKVRYARILRSSRAGIDSVTARLASGESAESILHADSLAGRRDGSLQERSANEQGTPYYRVLFEELRPGKFSVEGPDKDGLFMALVLVSRDDGRQLSYEEADHYVDEALQNIKGEERLNELLARWRKRYRIDWRPDLLMRVDLTVRTS